LNAEWNCHRRGVAGDVLVQRLKLPRRLEDGGYRPRFLLRSVQARGQILNTIA